MKFSQDEIHYIIAAIDKASKAILEIYATDFSVAQKQDQSPLTQADLVANTILIQALSQRWPNVPIFSEESTEPFSQADCFDYYWAIDPLDGTKEFIQKNGQFTVNVALINRGRPILGIVAAPAMDLLYVGQIEKGVQKRRGSIWDEVDTIAAEPDWSNNQLPIRVVASRSHPSPSLTSWLDQYPNHVLHEVGSSLKLCQVAEGQADCYPRLVPTCIWDIAAGHAILSAVGGEVWVWPIENRIPLRYPNPTETTNPSFMATGFLAKN
jgi:3'(2'), 5'-bisphosphate nucleotidase